MPYIILVIFAIVVGLKIYKIVKPNEGYGRENHYPTSTANNQQTATSPDYSNCYQRRLLFTKNEYYEFKKLKAYAKRKNLEVLAKVRLLDLVEPIRGNYSYQTLLHKIQAKHVDFVILDSNYYIKGIIEIDDNSHNTYDRKERDTFVDQVLAKTGYKILRTRSLTDEMLNRFLQQ